MTYLIGEMIALLAISCAIGFFVGWGFKKLIGDGSENREQDLSLQLGRIEAERNELQARLKRMQAMGAQAEPSSGAEVATSAVSAGAAAAAVAPAATSESRQMRGEYRVADLPGVSDRALHMMRDVGIRTTYDLLRESEGESKLRLLSTALEQDVDQVREWRTMADLLRVPGMDGKHARLLVSAGVLSVDALHDRQVEDLHDQLQSANEELQLVRSVADRVAIASWISYASPLSQLDLDG
ncbi:MAG: DUF4332 domain-containing protein [Granulosicoccaceae bacterium]